MHPSLRLLVLTAALVSSCTTSPTPTPASELPPASPAAPTSAPTHPSPARTPGTLAPDAITIQDGNLNPAYSLASSASSELEDNRMGVLAGGLTGGGWKPGEPWDYKWMADQVTRRGLKWFRVSIDNLDADSPDLDWSIPQYTIDPSHDALISLLAQRGVRMEYVLTFWDKDTWPAGEGGSCSRFKDPAEVERYLDFVRFIVSHFKDRIQAYELWNEPNLERCLQHIDVADYLALTRRAVPVIRDEFPEAEIVVGAPSYLGEQASLDYLLAIAGSDVMPLVDAISWHPMYGTSPEFDGEYYARYGSIVRQIKEAAAANGFEGRYRADELTWFTEGGMNWDGWSMRYPDVVAAKYTARAVVWHLGMDVAAGIGSALLFDPAWEQTPTTVTYLAGIMAGMTPSSLPVEIATQAEQPVSFTFSNSSGNRAIALWDDRPATEDSPSVNARLTLPDCLAPYAVGQDVIRGFEQQLQTRCVDGRLVIDGLLIQDYPLIFELTSEAP